MNWEYWNGSEWSLLPSASTPNAANVSDFTTLGTISFTVPADIASTHVNGQAKLWMRARLAKLTAGAVPASGKDFYGGIHTVAYSGHNTSFSFNVNEMVPPAIDDLCFGYVYRSPWTLPDQCFTYNDSQWENETQSVKWPGNSFPVFTPTNDATPTLYLGFDQPLPDDFVSFYYDIDETTPATVPLVWEAWDGNEWQTLQPTDETRGLTLPGMVAFVPPADVRAPPGDGKSGKWKSNRSGQSVAGSAVCARQSSSHHAEQSTELATVQAVQSATLVLVAPLVSTYSGGTVTLAALPRFGAPLDWVRTRLKEDGPPPTSQINGIYLNAVRAVQLRTNTNENLGAGSGQAGQVLTFNQNPVLPGERIEVQELTGALAQVQYPILAAELLSQGFTQGDIRTVTDPRSGNVTEVWVRWQAQPTLYFSGPDSRHYMMERAGAHPSLVMEQTENRSRSKPS